VVFDNRKKRSSECDLYLRAYMQGLMQRISCEKCPYANPYRRSDITLGDFWGIEDIFPTLKKQFHKGISLVMSNTEKGNKVCEKLTERMNLIQTELSYAFNGKNMQLKKPVQPNKRKKPLYEDVKKMGIKIALIKALGLKSLILIHYGWCINMVKAYLPKKIYEWIVDLKHNYASCN
jgi:hypothetical protein